ncbi:MAG: methionine synthase [Lachnospiraceae bacterium]|jgi:Predicted cobalamin binding protein|nr:methionine synthase [Lachnospiraceae bacterium]MCI9659006.1 methionine synthase [Lachnospiraceae bacterium]
MELLEKLRQAIERGHPNEAERLACTALDSRIDPLFIVDDAMMPAMRSVGERYKNDEADILRILAAARSVRICFELIEKRRLPFAQKHIGTIILGTIEGDLHDVGKNLVAIMFRSAGFRVVDLGVDISEKKFLKAVAETPDVSIVCISSLLSTTLPEMEQTVKALRRNDPKKRYRIMVGGGAVTRQAAEQMGADAYTENCVEAAEVAKTFIV